MKIVIMGLDGASSEQLLGDERLTHLRWLMGIGCYGKLNDIVHSSTDAALAIGEQIASAGKRVRKIGASLSFLPGQISDSHGTDSTEIIKSMDEIYAQSRQRFESARDFMQNGKWDCVLILENGLDLIQRAGNGAAESDADAVRNYYQHLDTEWGTLLELLDNDTAILIVSAYKAESSFILVAPNNPLYGEIEGVYSLDLAPTLLELGGDILPELIQGKSLVAGKTLSAAGEAGYSQEEEEIVRERLKGLGYI